MTERGSTIFLALSFAVLLFVVAFRKNIMHATGINAAASNAALGDQTPGLSNQVSREPTTGPAYMGANWGYPNFMSGMLPITSTGTVKNTPAMCGTC